MNKKYFLGAILFQILVLVGCGDAKSPTEQDGFRLPLTEGPAEPPAPPIDLAIPETVGDEDSTTTGTHGVQFEPMDIDTLNLKLSEHSSKETLPEELVQQVQHWISSERSLDQHKLMKTKVELPNIDGTEHPAGTLGLFDLDIAKELIENNEAEDVLCE